MSEYQAAEVRHLSVNYGDVPVLWDLTFSVPQGNIVGVIGPNGAGKTTFIKTLLGLVKPMSGNFTLLGRSLKEVRQKIAYVPQKESVDWDFPITVLELVLMGRYGRLGLFKRPREADIAAAHDYLKMVGMGEYAHRQISQLSGGQQQRVFLARALIQESDLYFMDEPFVGVDLATKQTIMDLLINLKKKGKTVFVVHHELNEVESFFDWLVMLNVRLVASGATQDVFTKEMLEETYGTSSPIFDQALQLSKKKEFGLPV